MFPFYLFHFVELSSFSNQREFKEARKRFKIERELSKKSKRNITKTIQEREKFRTNNIQYMDFSSKISPFFTK